MQRLQYHRLRQSFVVKLFSFIAAVFLFVCALRFYSRRGEADLISDVSFTPLLPSTNSPDDINNGCYVDLDLLKSNGYNTSAQYARLEIAVVRTGNFTDFSNDLNASFPQYHSIPLDTPDHRLALSQKICSPAVTIHAPMPVARPNASHILFGVSTTLARLDDSLDTFAHWAGGTNTQIFALIELVPNSQIAKVQKRADALGIRLTIIDTPEERLDQYFSLIRVLHEHRDESTQWAAFIDDDTFFPSMSNLVDRLASYDATMPQYIGALTEDFAQMFSWSYMAYGGAGIFLSMPLLDELNDVYDDCYDYKTTGDRRIARCIYEHTSTKLTWDKSLYQLDLSGDASGFYESGRPLPVSVHHWKSWFQADMVGLSQAAAICGEQCLLHRWRLSDDWFLVNGFSIFKYSSSVDLDSINKTMEKTWEKSRYRGGDGFAFSLGPFYPRDEGKIQFRLRNATQENGIVRQIYIHELAPQEPQVLEVVWKLAPTI